MAINKSIEVTAKEASSGEKYNNLAGVQTAEFTYNSTTGAAENDIIELVELPVGSEIIGYATTSEAWGSGITISLGTAASGTQLTAGIDVAALGNDSGFMAPVALGATAKVHAKVLGGAGAADKDFNGVIFYI